MFCNINFDRPLRKLSADGVSTSPIQRGKILGMHQRANPMQPDILAAVALQEIHDSQVIQGFNKSPILNADRMQSRRLVQMITRRVASDTAGVMRAVCSAQPPTRESAHLRELRCPRETVPDPPAAAGRATDRQNHRPWPAFCCDVGLA